MIDALTSAYTRKDSCHNNPEQILETNIGKLFAVLAWGLESVREQAYLIQSWDDIDNARGSVLDRYGANLGVKRISQDDKLYRLSIKIKMVAMLSGGDTDTLIRMVSALFNISSHNIDVKDIYPAKVGIYINYDSLSLEYRNLGEPITHVIKRILPAGVGINLYFTKKRTYRYRIKVVSGSFFYTHIKSKRIE